MSFSCHLHIECDIRPYTELNAKILDMKSKGMTWQQKERQATPWQSRPKSQDPQYPQSGDPQYVGTGHRNGGGGISDFEYARRANANKPRPTRWHDGFKP